MRNAIIVALGLVCAALVLSSATTSAERISTGGGRGDNGGGDNDSVPVAVQNFPDIQLVQGAVDVKNFPLTVNVAGAVDVGNFPETQNVTGTVEVSNLPPMAGGSVQLSGSLVLLEAQANFVGITTAIFAQEEASKLVFSRACGTEFPGTRVCSLVELENSIPPPPIWPGRVWALVFSQSGFGCVDSSGGFSGGFPPECEVASPAICCGF